MVVAAPLCDPEKVKKLKSLEEDKTRQEDQLTQLQTKLTKYQVLLR